MVQSAERSDARANRARILAAAIAVFAERGNDAEIREIAERAGLAVGTVYNHFATKDDLLVAVLHEAIGGFERAIECGLAAPDAISGVRVFLREGLAVAEHYGALMAAMAEGRIPARNQGVDDTRRDAVHQRVMELVRRGLAEGRFRPDLDVGVASNVLSCVFLPWTLTELRQTHTADEIAEALMRIFLNGARSRSTDSLADWIPTRSPA